MFRDHTCGELTKKDLKKTVTLSGWVNSRRDHGGVIFIDLRDRYGVTQVKFDPVISQDSWNVADKVRSEYVIKVTGQVLARPDDMVNPKLATGEVEVTGTAIEILNKAKTPPFEIDVEKEVNEDIRLKYRFLDLRKKRLQENLIFRAQVIKFLRDWMHERDFIEIETPLLTASSPEGARDFLVPSRLHPGKFYALPQAPQQYKQLLMVAGLDKYFQVAACLRDEDARADRSPGEFYQLDVETSFLTQDEFFALMEPLLIDVSKKFSDKKIWQVPFPRLPYAEVMLKYGSDKPDLRFGLEIQDISDLIKDCKFEAFTEVIKQGGVVRIICAPGAEKLSRKDLNDLTNFAMDHGAKGLGYIEVLADGAKSPLTKFLGEELITQIIDQVQAKAGDIIFFCADTKKVVCTVLAALRLELGKRLNLIDEKLLCWAWITDFPMYEYNEEQKKIDFCHNPFSMPQGGLEDLENKDPLEILAYQYDIICNGYELSSGAVRSNVPEIIIKAFAIAGYSEDEVRAKFGHMISAFEYGAPPHCGFAPGIERLVMLLKGENNIREMTAFPKNGRAEDVMMGAPSEVKPEQLKELHIKLSLDK